jgi:hypothetical protein
VVRSCCVLAALGPNHAAITALEGKVEAVRTAMSACVGLMVADLAAEAAAGSAAKAAQGQSELAAEVAATQQAASEGVSAAMASHQEALMVGADTLLGLVVGELRPCLTGCACSCSCRDTVACDRAQCCLRRYGGAASLGHSSQVHARTALQLHCAAHCCVTVETRICSACS